MRFLLDECVPVRLAELLRAAGHDCSHVYDAGLRGRLDEQIMAVAEGSPHPDLRRDRLR